MKNEVGRNIRNYRKSIGMSQRHLATKVGISQQGLFKIEKELVNPKVSTVVKIIEILRVTPNQLFGLDDDVGQNK